ncbi:hypothetical protein QQS21_005582 [Conoideocrella luteorostrata]|uniref:Cytidyltransferase-like domain-containing protein n=1 Tax=Conoideocrella luteorostrata TaxID=1105319 RepID=A0AAJ0CP86_9HYPO|nr:hypothetical protein QQS21_005582 [Conoideocrella luteorostrata]
MLVSDSGNPPPSLLLLPPPPQPATPEAVWAAYRDTLECVISRLSNEHKSSVAGGVAPVLVVAVASPVLTTADTFNKRSVFWGRSQSLLAEIYSTVAVICAERSIASDIEAEDPGAVDVRVLLVHYDRSSKLPYEPNSSGVYEANNTTLVDLATFASSVHPWRQIFHSSSELGYEILTAYLNAAEGKQKLLQNQLIAVEGGISLSKLSPTGAVDTTTGKTSNDFNSGYAIVCLGGTFDHLHLGHKLFLHAATLLLNVDESSGAGKEHQCELVVGISSDELLAKKNYAEELQSWNIRASFVVNFLSTLFNRSTTTATTTMKTVQVETKEIHVTFRDGAILVRCVDFHDVYGPTVKEEAIQALVVSGETRNGGQAVNEKRRSQGWSMLDVYEINVLDANTKITNGERDDIAVNNFAGKVSSTEIRKQKAQRRQISP